MKLKEEDKPSQDYDYLRRVVVEEIMDYVVRVANINMDNPNKFGEFLNAIETELVKVATNRKFLVLNTNVIRETHTHVFSNQSLRSFHMELASAIAVRFAVEMKHITLDSIMAEIVNSYSDGVLHDNPDPQGIVLHSPEMASLASQMKVTEKAIEYLESNKWYYSIILCNLFAATILDRLRALRKDLTAKTK